MQRSTFTKHLKELFTCILRILASVPVNGNSNNPKKNSRNSFKKLAVKQTNKNIPSVISKLPVAVSPSASRTGHSLLDLFADTYTAAQNIKWRRWTKAKLTDFLRNINLNVNKHYVQTSYTIYNKDICVNTLNYSALFLQIITTTKRPSSVEKWPHKFHLLN